MIRLLYLYYDLMNLYGESGNMRAMERALREQGLDVQVDLKTADDPIDFSLYSFIYAGCGTESSRDLALRHLSLYAEDLRAAIENGCVLLFTGNAWEMFGTKILTCDQRELTGLGFFDFSVLENGGSRIIGDVLCSCRFLKQPLIGFINKCSETTPLQYPLFEMQLGEGNTPGDSREGIHVKNVFGTHLIGPVLIRNPHFTEYLVRLITEPIEDFSYTQLPHPYEEAAYEAGLRELTAKLEKENK